MEVQQPKLKELIITKPLLYEVLKGLIEDKSMNIKMAINPQLSVIKSKLQTKQTTRTGTET